MQVEHIPPSDILTHLANRFQKWLAFNIANCAANFHDNHIRVGLACHRLDTILNLIGDMRNDLNGTAEVLSASLFANDRSINLPGRYIIGLIRWFIGETLVMSQIEIGLCAIVSHKDFSVLIRRHCTRIDIDIGV